MSFIRDMYYGMEHKSLKIGTRFAVDSFQCTESALGKVTFKWEHPDGENAIYNLEMLTDLHIPRITRDTWDLSMSGCLNYNETQRDNVTGKEHTVYYKVKFRAEFEYQSDNNFHVVQFKRIPEKSETTKTWIFELYNEGMMYLTGEGFPKNRDKAVEKFREAAGYDHAGAKNMLAKLGEDLESADELNEQGMTAYNAEDYTKAVELFCKAAERGLAEAQNNMGNCCYNGEGVEQDYKKAVEWYRKAADQEHEQAQNNMGNCYYSGDGVPQDYAKAAEWYRKAADQGYAEAQNILGVLYEEGNGVPQDNKKAVEWYRKAAEQENMYAQYSLGDCLFDGKGVPQNKTEAVKWWAKSAEQCYDVAQNDLGYAYHHGEGVEQDYVKALEYYTKAAEQGNAGSVRNIGVLYRDGLGVKKDLAKAEELFNKAIAAGDEKAKESLAELKKK